MSEGNILFFFFPHRWNKALKNKICRHTEMWQSVPCHQSDDTLKIVTAIRVEGIRQDCKQRGPPMRIYNRDEM